MRRTERQSPYAHTVSVLREGCRSETMKESCLCEVIGCDSQACWLLVVCQDVYHEDFLCDSHWQLLHLHDPRLASRYTHLSSLLAEGLGLMTGVPTANRQRICGSASHSDT